MTKSMANLVAYEVWISTKSYIAGGRHSTAVAFTLCTQPARVRITAAELLQKKISNVAVLIDRALLREWTVQCLK